MKNLINKFPFLKTAAISCSMIFASSTYAFDNIYIFGDSLSDTGNIALIVNGAPERFSNGPVAVDILTASYGLQAIPSLAGGNNYAFGGATATGSETEFDTNLPIQVNTYLSTNNFSADPSALYAIIIGGNDLFAAQEIRSSYLKTAPGAERQAIRKASKDRVSEAVASVELQLMKLISAGAQNILVGNAPDIGSVPATDDLVAFLLSQAETNAEERRAIKMYSLSSKLTAQYNRELAKAITRIESNTGLDIEEWDLEGFLNEQIEDAEELGYTNTEDSCSNDGQLPLCEGYVFVDGVHPTTVVHQRAGADVTNLLNQ